jgi:hypothetical protein
MAAVLEAEAHGKGQQRYEQRPPKMPMELQEILLSVGVLVWRIPQHHGDNGDALEERPAEPKTTQN